MTRYDYDYDYDWDRLRWGAVEELASGANAGLGLESVVRVEALKGGGVLESEPSDVAFNFLAVKGVAAFGESDFLPSNESVVFRDLEVVAL